MSLKCPQRRLWLDLSVLADSDYQGPWKMRQRQYSAPPSAAVARTRGTAVWDQWLDP